MALSTLARYTLGSAVAAALAVGIWQHRSAEATSWLERGTALARQAQQQLPGVIQDPLIPARPVQIAGRELPAGWVVGRPRAEYQYSRPPSARRGVEPCATPEPDHSALTPWQKLTPFGQYVAPELLLRGDATEFDLVVHFHGHEPARKELARAGVPLVLAGVSLEPGQSYAKLLAGGKPMQELLDGVERSLSSQSGRTMRLRHLAVSAWSAGFEGVRAVLHQPVFERVEAVVLLDGLHTPRDPAALQLELADFVELARRAARGEKWFIVTHSSIDPPNFSSTTETAHHLIAALGGRPLTVRREDRYGLELVEFYSRGDFQVRGYAGNDKADHCAQFGAYRDVLVALARHFRHAG